MNLAWSLTVNEIIAVFRMNEVSIDSRIRIIRKLGLALDNQYAMNWTGEIVEELITHLETISQKEAV
jgi:hypothetical protein